MVVLTSLDWNFNNFGELQPWMVTFIFILTVFRRDVVVYVADDPVRAKEAETVLAYLGYSNVQCYLGGMKEWAQAGGLTKFPKFVSYTVIFRLLNQIMT